ncbi:MAG: protein phosphatase 2C domain-containing protein [Austwickia sp.]|nr:protein phosphatase 2C domain-containing protein [Austwickia sp.]
MAPAWSARAGTTLTATAPSAAGAAHRRGTTSLKPPAPWLAGVCDRGIRHTENQDAMAVRVDPTHPGRAALVVCDGVTTAIASADASLAAAEAAAAVLTSSRAQGLGLATAREAALIARLEAAADAASDAVGQVTDAVTSRRAQESTQESGSPPPAGSTALSLPACTFVAAVIEEDFVVVGSVGDSRAYWLPEPPGVPALLTLDDSLAGEQVRAGMDRALAETGPHAHTITRWLGADAPDHTPTSRAFEPEVAGWLLLCSDGLWNYASGELALAAVVAQVAAQVGAGPTAQAPFGDPLALAEGLVRWAKQQGGHDNITAVLARLGSPPAPASSPAVAVTDVPSEDAVHG